MGKGAWMVYVGVVAFHKSGWTKRPISRHLIFALVEYPFSTRILFRIRISYLPYLTNSSGLS